MLGNYLFCYSNTFKSTKNIFLNLKFTKGLKQILFSNEFFQNEIIKFINLCKIHEDKEGYISNTFFKSEISSKGKIINGIFSEHVFKLLDKNKKDIKVLVGDIKFTILDNSNTNYLSI